MQIKKIDLSQVALLQDLTPEELKDVDEQMHLVTYSAGHLFYMPEDPAEVLFILKKGQVQLYRISPDGRKLVVALLKPGAIFGHMALVGQGLHNTYAQALDDVTICVWNREKVDLALQRNPQMALRLLNAVGERLMQAEERLTEVTFKRLPARLASLLLHLREENQSDELSGYTHQHLADMLGTYRETVTQILNDWKSDGTIELSRKHITIFDNAKLAEIASHW